MARENCDPAFGDEVEGEIAKDWSEFGATVRFVDPVASVRVSVKVSFTGWAS